MKRDAEHLKLLAIFHFIWAGLIAMTGLIGIIYIPMGIFMIRASAAVPPPGAGGGGGPPPTFMGYLFLGLGAAFILFGVIGGLLVALAGWNLTRRKGWTFCFVIACLSCMNAPLGTALGVCTILVLNRQSVKDLFAGKIVEPRDPDEEEADDWDRERPPAEEPTVTQQDRPAPREDDDRYYSTR
jgi:hypothetical protein